MPSKEINTVIILALIILLIWILYGAETNFDLKRMFGGLFGSMSDDTENYANQEWQFIGWGTRAGTDEKVLLQSKNRLFKNSPRYWYRAIDVRTGKDYPVRDDTDVLATGSWILVIGKGFYYVTIE